MAGAPLSRLSATEALDRENFSTGQGVSRMMIMTTSCLQTRKKTLVADNYFLMPRVTAVWWPLKVKESQIKILLLELLRMMENVCCHGVEVVVAGEVAQVGMVMVDEELAPRVAELNLLQLVVLHALRIAVQLDAEVQRKAEVDGVVVNHRLLVVSKRFGKRKTIATHPCSRLNQRELLVCTCPNNSRLRGSWISSIYFFRRKSSKLLCITPTCMLGCGFRPSHHMPSLMEAGKRQMLTK